MARIWLVSLALLSGCVAQPHRADRSGEHLLVWVAPQSNEQSDFLAAIDLDPQSPTYARVVATVAAPGPTGGAHHTEYEMPDGGILAANAFGSGRTYLFDVSDPRRPKFAGSLEGAGDYSHPHSFARFPNGNLLATFQERGHGNERPGALVEYSPDGRMLRSSDAADPGVEPFIRPYSLTIVPELDRVVTTSADMHSKDISRAVQVWRLSDMSLVKTVRLPTPPAGIQNEDPAEPRLLADGRTVAVSTFTCGLFLLEGLDGQDPVARFIHKFSDTDKCAVPVVAGRFWVQADASLPGLISLDMSVPSQPSEVDRLILAPDELPHWIALAPDGRRIVISGGKEALRSRVLLAKIDPATGKLSLDSAFRPAGAARPGVTFDQASWPHGASGTAIPHGAVFSRPRS
ncbi:MAG TPA: hypothetical protein VEA61_10810 [Allosphingosinicella sp.]|nr:hypothetical protein [Allosphingosinicella sp.]